MNPRKHLIARLSFEALISVSQKLPPADLIHKIDQAIFEVWRIAPEHPLVIEARGAYYRYGNYPPLDIYDNKSAVYLARASYGGHQEFLSVRFIPGDGRPLSSEDLDRCLAGQTTIKQKFKDLIRQPDFLGRIATISRLCGIPAPIAGRLRFTREMFILINRVFLENRAKRKPELLYLTGLFRDELLEHSFVGLRFINAKDFFGLEEDIKIDRDFFAFRFPGYFLQVGELFSVLARLGKEGLIAPAIFNEHLRDDQGFLMIQNGNLPLDAIKNLAPILTASKIVGASIGGAELRSIINKEVGDGPRLRIMKAEDWRRDMYEALTF